MPPIITTINIPTNLFSFRECLRYLGRNEQECSHFVDGDRLYTLVYWGKTLYQLDISHNGQELIVGVDQTLSVEAETYLSQYIRNWFDLDMDLSTFYEAMRSDTIMEPLTQKFQGLPMMRMANFFEALCWSILGQQINLRFAYQLKRQFAEKYGQAVPIKGRILYQFPEPERIARLDIETLKEIQFSKQKANYIIGIAQAFCAGRLNKADLEGQRPEAIHQQLIALKGIGNWTASYILMKVFGDPSAFPIADVGLHNALKEQLGLDKKPSLEEIQALAKPWQGWEAYATFYLWHSLLK